MPGEDAAQPVRRPHPGGVAMAALPSYFDFRRGEHGVGRACGVMLWLVQRPFPGALTSGDDFGGVESSAEGHGEAACVAEALATEGDGVHVPGPPQRGQGSSAEDGTGGSLHGGRGGDVRNQGSEEANPSSPASRASSGNSPSHRRAGWPERRSRPGASRTARRNAPNEGGPGEVGGAVERRRGSQGHHRAAEGEDQAASGRSDGESPWLQLTGEPEARRRRRPRTPQSAWTTTAASVPTGPTVPTAVPPHPVLWGLQMSPDGQGHFAHFNPHTRSAQGGWVLTPHFYQLNETDDQML